VRAGPLWPPFKIQVVGGYSFGDGGGAFSEFGLGGPPGASLAGYYMWEIPWEDIWELLLKYLLKPKEDPCP